MDILYVLECVHTLYARIGGNCNCKSLKVCQDWSLGNPKSCSFFRLLNMLVTIGLRNRGNLNQKHLEYKMYLVELQGILDYSWDLREWIHHISWNRYIVCAVVFFRNFELVKNLPPIIPDNQNWYCVQSSCGDVPQRTYGDVRSLFLVGCPAAWGQPSTFTAQPLRGGLGGNKHLAALPASKDAVSPSLLSCILYPGRGGYSKWSLDRSPDFGLEQQKGLTCKHCVLFWTAICSLIIINILYLLHQNLMKRNCDELNLSIWVWARNCILFWFSFKNKSKN